MTFVRSGKSMFEEYGTTIMAAADVCGRVLDVKPNAENSPGVYRRSAGLIAVGFALALGVVPSQAQPVQGDAIAVGFQAAVPARHVVKYGRWFPIILNLTAQGTQAYEVQLQCERTDLDGDRVDFVEPHVVVTPEIGVKRVWCYAVTIKEGGGERLGVDIIGADGIRIHTVPTPAFEPIGNDTYLILDISSQRVTGLDRINSPAENYLGFAWARRTYYRSICVATLACTDLPDRWYGLDAADVVVWDAPDPEALSIAQLNALMEWVRNGGQLVVGVGAAGANIQKSALAAIMPLEFTQPATEIQRLDTFRRQFDTLEEQFKTPIPVACGQPAPGAIVTLRDGLPDKSILNLIALRCVGSGRVIASAAHLRDLEKLGPEAERFYRELFDLNRVEPEFRAKEAEEINLFSGVQNLYQPIITTIDFRQRAGALILAAFAFVAAYILLATFGTWNWLKRHALTGVSWTAFAGFALVASAGSIAAVAFTRGVTGAVHAYCFVDLQEGSSEARARAYFGYKSNRRQRVDLSVSGVGGTLCPLGTGADFLTPYATPERYEALASSATLTGTPMRATLKQFQAYWNGATDGRILGKLTADRGSGRITLDSWIENGLGADIYDGYLLYIDPRLSDRDGGTPCRIAGWTRRNDRPGMGNKVWGFDRVPPALNVLAVRLAPMKAGERLEQVGRNREYARFDDAFARWSAVEQPDPKSEPWLPNLHGRLEDEWSERFGLLGGGLDSTDAAALRASMRNLYLHTRTPDDFVSVGRPISTDGLLDHDVTHWLTRGQAVLLLLSDRPGPVKLQVDGEPKETKEGRTLYRVRVPLQYIGMPPRG